MGGKCRHCDEKLQATVLYCPYCGVSQALLTRTEDVTPVEEPCPPLAEEKSAESLDTGEGDLPEVTEEATSPSHPTRWQNRLVVSALVVLLAILAGAIAIIERPVMSLVNDPCPDQGLHAGALIILLGQTDNLPTLTRREIENRAWASVIDKSREGDWVGVYYLSQASQGVLEPVFQMCRPAAPTTASRLLEKVGLQKLNFKRDFELPFRQVVSASVPGREYNPIAEALYDILLSSHVGQSNRVRIMIFSDLIQHSPNASLQGCSNPAIPIEVYKRNQSGATVRPTWVNTTMELHVAPRRGLTEMEIQCRSRFWNWYLGDMRGTSYGREVLDLPGSFGLMR